ncbi:MAG: hypothetical protein ACFFCO_12390 [Promethearchaeota archaeon]
MAQDMEFPVTWKYALGFAMLLALIYIGVDWLHFLFLGTKFTYLINYLSPTAASDFWFYIALFAGVSFMVGLLMNFETKDVVIAGILGPFIFLGLNGLIIHIILLQNPTYAIYLIPQWQDVYGVTPDWYAIQPELIFSFWILYANSLWLFFVLAFPFILVCCFSGHVIRVMSGWHHPI